MRGRVIVFSDPSSCLSLSGETNLIPWSGVLRGKRKTQVDFPPKTLEVLWYGKMEMYLSESTSGLEMGKTAILDPAATSTFLLRQS